MTPTDLALFVGATVRTTRLVREDTITAPLRHRVNDAAERGNRRAELAATWLECPWCVSLWCATAVGIGYLVLPRDVWQAGAAALTASQVTGEYATRIPT